MNESEFVRNNKMEPLKGDETARVVADLYSKLGPRVGCRLVEANLVLTMAGARGQADVWQLNLSDEDRDKVNLLSDGPDDQELRLKVLKNTRTLENGKVLSVISIKSLRGIDLVSHRTRFPGISPFDASLGWSGYVEWSREAYSGLEEYVKTLGVEDYDQTTLWMFDGFLKGYPDVAVLDATKPSSGTSGLSISTKIEHVSVYGGEVPDFIYHPDHKNNPDIKRVVEEWGRILGEFYDSDWHKKISKDPNFILQRRVRSQEKL